MRFALCEFDRNLGLLDLEAYVPVSVSRQVAFPLYALMATEAVLWSHYRSEARRRFRCAVSSTPFIAKLGKLCRRRP